MIQPIVFLFVVLSVVFALLHWVAVELSLYWYYWWFDVMMHFFGGFLIALGVVALTTFRRIRVKPSYRLVLAISLLLVVGWELFEWRIGLMIPQLHWLDAVSDMVLGVGGGLIGFTVLKRLRYRT